MVEPIYTYCVFDIKNLCGQITRLDHLIFLELLNPKHNTPLVLYLFNKQLSIFAIVRERLSIISGDRTGPIVKFDALIFERKLYIELFSQDIAFSFSN